MATPREIRRRIRSVRNTAQITRAMEMVAASRMRRAQQQVTATRPYAERIRAMIADLASMSTDDEEEQKFPLLDKRPIRRSEMILITSDRGLKGALNANVIRQGVRFLGDRPEGRENVNVVAVGRKGRDFLTRFGQPLAAEFTQLPPQPELADIRPIVQLAVEDFTSGRVDAVYVVYTRFVNTLRQVPEVLQVLPIEAPEGTGEVTDYIFEPSPEVVLEALLPRFVEVQIYQAMLEAIASEHSAQMVAMRNATENARDLVSQLTMTYNKARQAQITSEVSEIAAGANALG